MTKLKNTKKGMAKKALSISLVAAMLATSNVPVWAAEDIFTDSSAEIFSDMQNAPAETDFIEEAGEEDLLRAVPNNVTYAFKQNGQTVFNEAVIKDGTLTVEATLDEAIGGNEEATIYLIDSADDVAGATAFPTAKATNTFTSGNVVSVSYTLKENEAGKIFRAIVVHNDKTNRTITRLGDVADINVVESATVITGTPTIDAGGTDNISLGTVLTAKTDDMGPEGTAFKYQWQVTDADGNWTNINGATAQAYRIADSGYYGHQIRVAVYSGIAYEETKARFSASVTVGPRELTPNANGKINVNGTVTQIQVNAGNDNKQKVFSAENTQNELTDKDITVTYTNLAGQDVALTYGVDYTVTYSQLYHLGEVIVTVNILPTAKTDYTKDTYTADELNYTLVPGIDLDGYQINYNAAKTYEYTGQKITPEVSSVTYVDSQGKNVTLPASDYTTQEIGPNAGNYPLSVYVKDRGLVYVGNNGAVDNNAVTVTKKSMASHDADFVVEIPEQIWKADAADVEANTVKNAPIKMYDTAADPNKINDLLASGQFNINVVNWSDSSIKKSIRFTARANATNYAGSIIRDGEETKSNINEFKAAFLNALAPGNNLIYNGAQQDYLHTLLYSGGNYGKITLNGTQLFLNRDFTYKITQGGTNAGDVSYTITGAGVYAGTEMILSNAYKIQPAVFSNNAMVADNRDNNNVIEVPFNPSLGDKGADIRNYEILGKDVYKAWMVGTNYNLTLDKDFWLDSIGIGTNAIMWTPTVAENKVAGHGKNENFRQDNAATTNRTAIMAELVDKNLNDKDISIQILDAAYNGGSPVIPKIKVVYTAKDGKEYVISDDYYNVEVTRAAVNEGDKGKINVSAKNIANTAKYPQMYTGNQIVEFTVGTPSLDGGKILATNGLSTLPSVAYSAEQAATSKGIILAEGNYVVKDKSGNTVDPKYYNVTFTDNKKAGTATITVTGKAPYTGSTSANFTITNAMLPSGTVTLMSDKLSKTYTGEEVKLVKGTDYTITGELSKLAEGTDYMITYENAVNVTSADSKAKIKFVGIGSYAGELVKTFDITPAKISEKDIALGDTTYAAGKTIKPTVTITIPGGTTVLEADKYTVDYVPAATNVGDTGKVVITYNADNKNIDAKDSVKTVEYGVTAKDLKDVTIASVEPQEATGEQLKPVLSVTNDSVQLKEGVDYQVTYGDNKEVGKGTATITPVDGNKNYTGSQTVEFAIIKKEEQVGTAKIEKATVTGNKVVVDLSSHVENAKGYDFVIATEQDYKNGRVSISKNIVGTSTTFRYVDEGVYYAYCHAWTRDEDGKKVFGGWSNLFRFEVTATTPATPKVTSVKVSGNTVKVTYTKSNEATGYDIVLGKKTQKVNGELRPVEYGKLVKKVYKGNTVTATFTKVPKGTYYAGLHAYNRTSENSAKVFSKWSNSKKVTVK
ncbi:hypothetical protein NXH76_15045 [Blautia schinkii]|nr:hypothetical protein [Blautia schinkii]